MSAKIRINEVVQILGLVGVPVTAFIIRMSQGDTRNENEEIISLWIRTLIVRILFLFTRKQATT